MPRAFHHRFGYLVYRVVSLWGGEEGREKKERGEKRERKKKKQQIDTIPAVESLLFEGVVSVSRANEIQEI